MDRAPVRYGQDINGAQDRQIRLEIGDCFKGRPACCESVCVYAIVVLDDVSGMRRRHGNDSSRRAARVRSLGPEISVVAGAVGPDDARRLHADARHCVVTFTFNAVRREAPGARRIVDFHEQVDVLDGRAVSIDDVDALVQDIGGRLAGHGALQAAPRQKRSKRSFIAALQRAVVCRRGRGRLALSRRHGGAADGDEGGLQAHVGGGIIRANPQGLAIRGDGGGVIVAGLVQAAESHVDIWIVGIEARQPLDLFDGLVERAEIELHLNQPFAGCAVGGVHFQCTLIGSQRRFRSADGAFQIAERPLDVPINS